MSELLDYVQNMEVIDTHEHIVSEEDWLKRKNDFSTMLHYIRDDAISAGLPVPDMDRIDNPEWENTDAKWQMFKPYWGKIKNTGYSRSLLLILRDLYGIDDLTDSTVPLLTQKLAEVQKKGYFKYIMRDKARIRLAIRNVVDEDSDPELFVSTMIVNCLCNIDKVYWLNWIEGWSGRSITNFDTFFSAIDAILDKGIKKGIKGFKWGMAYQRRIQHDDVTKYEAEKAFNDHILTYPVKQYSPGAAPEWKPFQDYFFHHIIQRSLDYKVPVQIHTGIMAGNSVPITNSNPTLLVNLFLKYPKARFDIFHGGYPYTGEMATLAKNFPNVYLNMCWMHIISPTASINALKEWLETIPSNKIFAFGGDYLFVEGAYAHSKIARKGVGRVLRDMVDDGYFSEKEAIQIARRILFDNSKELYKLDV